MEIKDYRGKVSKCHCTNADPDTPMSCNECFCRGYVAQCLACSGTGQKTIPVAGGVSGEMKSTCEICGGRGKMGVNKPEDWDILHPTIAEEPEPEAAPVEEVAAVA